MPTLLRLLLLPLLLGLAIAAPKPFPQASSDLKVDAAIRYGTLPNGFRYALRANSEPKGRAALRFVVLAGSFHEKDSQQGLAHFLEHMSFNGSSHFPPGTLIEYFQRLGMDFGNDTNAYTSFDQTVYMIELPDTKPETLAEGLKVIADYAGGLLLTAKEINKERGIILAEKRTRDSVQYRTFIAEYNFLYAGSLIPKRIPIGEEDVISKAGRDEFLDFYNTWYRPDLCAVVAVGDFDVNAVEKQITEALSPITNRAPERRAPDIGSPQKFQGVRAGYHYEQESPMARLSINTIIPYTKEQDSQALRLKFLPRLLAQSMLNKRLAILAKKEGAQFTSANIGFSDLFDALRQASISITCKGDQWQAALGVADQELRRALQYGFQPAELKEASANFKNMLEQAVKTAKTRRSPDLATEIVGGLTDEEVVTSPEYDLELYLPALVKTTPEDCLKSLREAWAPDHRSLFVTGNAKIEGDAQAAILAAYETSSKLQVARPATIADAVFAYTDFGPAGTIKKQERIEDLDITLVEFANGVRLNLKKTDFEAGKIRIGARVGYGQLIEPRDLKGLSAYTSSAFTLGGLGKHSLDDLQRLLAGKTLGTGFRVGADALAFSGATNREDLLLQLQLFTAFITDPGYRPEASRQLSKFIEQMYNRIEHTPEGPFELEVARLLASGDSRFGLPSREVMMRRNTGESKAWLSKQLSSGYLEINAVGDLDVQATIDAVAKTLGALPPREARPPLTEERKVSFPSAPIVKEFTVETKIPKAVLALYWPTTDASEASTARRLNMLAEVFNDRLRVKVREELGDAYSPNALSNPSQIYTGYGYLEARVTLDPAQCKPVAEVVLAIAEDLATKGVTEDELLRAKKPTLAQLKVSARTNAYWSAAVLHRAQEEPKVLAWARTRLADVEAISAAELSALAKSYLPRAKASQITVLPKAP